MDPRLILAICFLIGGAVGYGARAWLGRLALGLVILGTTGASIACFFYAPTRPELDGLTFVYLGAMLGCGSAGAAVGGLIAAIRASAKRDIIS